MIALPDALRADTLLDRFGPFPPKPHLTVALSGGADSMALALLAEEWARARGGRITTLTVDHALRSESRAEALQVAGWMHARHIEHHILTPPHTADSNNLQESARTWRYNALADWCHAHDVLHCLIAHHAGDQRETIALMQARGETADGNAGMQAVRNYRGVRFIRPLLNTEKEQLQKFLLTHAARWVEDPTNQDTTFARVRIRQQLQSDRAMEKHLTHQAKDAAIARNTRDQALARTAVQCVQVHPLGFADMNLDAWHKLEPMLASQLLADVLTTISGSERRPRGHETLRLADALLTDFKRATLHGCDVSLNGRTLRISREEARCAPAATLRGTGFLYWDNRFAVYYALPDGVALTLRPLGRNGYGLPASTPGLWHLDELAFLPHMLSNLPGGASASMGFSPAKPLAPAPFWWLN